MTKIPTIEELLKAGMHFGHRTSKWHPNMKPFIFGSRKGVHIIDLVKAQKMLETSMDILRKCAQEDKMVLFVGTKTQVKNKMQKMAEEAGMPYITEKWLGGCLTNFGVIKKMIKKYKDLTEKRDSGKLASYTKKERLEIDREIERLRLRVGGLVNVNRLPDLIFVWDIKTEKTAVAEAVKKNVPIMAVCDTNTNPKDINYIIPSNDDATKTIDLIVALIGETIKEGREAKKAEKPAEAK